MTVSLDTIRFVRYGVSGLFGAFVQTGVLWLWVGVFGMRDHYLWGIILGFLCALTTTFPLQKYWTFRDVSHRTVPRQILWYTVIALASLCINMILMLLAKAVLEYMQFDFFKTWYLLVQAVIVVVVAGLSFLSNRLITFNVVGDESL